MATETLAVNLLMNAGQYKREARQAATATGQIGNQARMTGTATGKLDKQMGGLAATAKFAVAGVAAGAIAGFASKSVNAFKGFDDAMNQSIAIMGDVEDSLRGDMEAAARDVGKTMRISAEEAAESFFFLASAGLDAEQSIAALPQVAAFAQAGMFDMALATDLATDAQSALGLTVDDAGENLENLTRVTDVLVGANTLANASVQQFSEALTQKAGAAMRAVGIEIEEGVAVLAAFADQGVKGADAGTQFAIVLRDLQSKALENKEAFAAAGIAVFDARGEFRPFAAVLSDIEDRLGGMSDAQRKAELATLGFTDKSISALTVLLGTSDAIEANTEGLGEFGGVAQDVADKQLDSMEGQLELAKGAVEDLQISLGKGLAPVLLSGAKLAADLAEQIEAMAGPIADLIGLLDNVKLGVDDAGREFSLFDQVLGGTSAAIGSVAFFGLPGLIDGFKELFGGTEELATATTELTDAELRARDAFAAVAGGIEGVNEAASDRAVSRYADAIGDLDDETGPAAASTKELAGWMRDVVNVAKEAASPIFAVQQAMERYEQALEDANEDGKVTNEELLELAQLSLEADSAFAELGAGDTLAGVRAIADTLDQPLEQIATMLHDMGILTDTQWQMIVGIATEISASDRALIRAATSQARPTHGGTADTRNLFRHSGGPGEAGMPYIIRPDEEVFIPQSNGQFVLNGEVMAALNGGSGGGRSGPTYIFYGDVYGDDAFMEKVAQANAQNGRLGR